MARTDYSGKRGSNAGDDYHELWAARRALELITPGTGLIELTVEGVRADDAEGMDEVLWDGVDAAFYYGPDIDTIEGVDLVQFKYSGSDPDTPWTVARLAYAKNREKTNALIARLASAWKGMRKQRRELDAAGNIVVKLASNQPLAQEVLDALAAAPGDAMRTKLQKASGLTLAEFAAFAPALDFSDCGDQSRFAHEKRVIQMLSGLTDGDVRAEFAVLREFIRKRMRPEGSRETITAESVFGIFGHADKRIFYPCPTEIARVSELVPRAAAGTIETMFTQGTQKICLAGAGGQGKTTVLQDLAQRLPTGSELIVYDCYGGGTYLNSNGYRHRAEDAFLQLANDTAARLLLPPLFSETGVDHPRRFARKLDATAAALASRHPDALLVIAVDAADNAVTAASQCVPPERAFVHDLARLGGLPANVRLMFSARTGRLADLELPDDVVLVPLEPFGPEESIRFAEARLGPQADDWHEEFHFHSGGNPRVQRYAIEFAGEVADAALDYLKPNGKNLELIFTTRFDEARTKSGSTAELARFCAALIVLPRPVPIDQLAGVLDAKLAHIRDLIADLAPGLVLADELVSFADEDFEHFLREAGASAMSEIGTRAADHLMARRMADPYAASHVANQALLAGRREDVIALVREPVADYPIADPAARGEVHRRRLRAAMHVCRETGNVIDAAALLLEGAQALKTDDAVQNTLFKHVELAANFSRDTIFSLLLRNRDKRPGHGVLLLQLAGIDGIAGDRIGMKSHFRSFLAWQDGREDAQKAFEDENDDEVADEDDPDAGMRRRRRDIARENFERDWKLEGDDVAAFLTGWLHAYGASEVLALIRRAQPARFRLEVLRCLVMRLARRGNLALLTQMRDALPLPHPGRPIVELAVGLCGGDFAAEPMLLHLEAMAARGGFDERNVGTDHMPDDAASEALRFGLDACDLVAMQAGDPARLAVALAPAMATSARTPSALASYGPRSSDIAARVFALANVLKGEPVTFDKFVVEPPPPPPPPKKVRGKKASQQRLSRDRESDLRKVKELFEPILQLHATRAMVLVGTITPGDALPALVEALKKLGAARRYYTREDEWRTRDDAAIRALLPLGLIAGMDAAALFTALRGALGEIGSLMRFGALDFLKHASLVPGFRPGIVELAVETCDHVRGIKISADEKIDYLVELAKLVLPIDAAAARYCFNAAMSVAGDVDYDTLHALSVTAALAKRARPAMRDADAECVALRLAAVHQDAAIRLGNADQFPWSDVAISLAALAPNIALAAVARFAELDLTSGSSMLDRTLLQCAADKTLDDRSLAAFLPILGEDGGPLATLLFEHAGTTSDRLLAEVVASHLLREPCGDRGKQIAAVAQLAEPGPAVHDLIAAANFEATLPQNQPVYSRYDSPASPGAGPKPIDPALLSVAGIDGIASFRARVDAIIAAEKSPYASRSAIANRLLANVPVHRIGEFLDLLISVPEEDGVVHDIAHFLREQLDRWHDKLAARQWARDRLLSVIEARLPEFLWYIDDRTPDLAALLKRSEANPAVIVSRLLSAIEQHITSLNSLGIFRLISLLSDYLTQEQAQGILDRHTNALHLRLEVADRNLPGFDTIGDSASSVARFIYAELGHVAQARRWRAGYGLRILARLGSRDILEQVRQRYDHRAEPAFSHPEAPFYFWAAKLWFMMGLARIAWETPHCIQGYRDWLFEQAESAAFPHLLVRASAKQALQGLAYADPNSFSKADCARIAEINTSKLLAQQSTTQSWHKGFDRHRPLGEEGRRFRFDSLDSLPYWYSPLMRCFAEPDPGAFLEWAERWIVDDLGVTDDILSYDKLRGNHRFNRRGRDSLNSHGSLPAVERYRTHLEWHALYLAGGEALAAWPLAADAEEDAYDNFDHWLSCQGLTLAPAWLGDLRGPKPLEAIAWQGPQLDDWLKMPDIDAVRRALGLDRSDWLVVSGHHWLHYGEASGSTRVESALVSRDMATSLRLALEASENSQDYRLAVNDDDSLEIASGRFVLKSLLVDWNGGTELDIHDPLRGEVSASGQLPHPRIVALLGLVRDPSGLPVWRDPKGVVTVQRVAWSDPQQPDERASRHSAQGKELLFRRSAIVQILEAYGLDLITEINFNRRIGEASYALKKDKKREREYNRIILYRHDGKIEASTRGLGRWA
ncbi:hypothetical protein [Tistrella sp.]|uniref:hypothetical protein n=1 Tax=Tistrella sp. TaxID=2024861 RepID=UPI0025F2C319|nr:hypothetical protein [Tistrella sp.]